MSSVIPFGELLDGATVRATTINGKNYLSVRDLIMVVCEKNANRSCEIWRRDIGEDRKQELCNFMQNFQFKGNDYVQKAENARRVFFLFCH
jgi:hypothetical protein